MAAITPREYQNTAVTNIETAFANGQSTLVVLATGLGKTVIAALVAKELMPKGKIMLLAHREELVFQGQRTIEAITGRSAQIEMADSYATTGLWGADIICSTYQTQIAGAKGGRMTRFNPNDFALIIADEAHHAVSPSQRAVLEYYKKNPNCKVLGLTATPDRLDEEALGQVFENVAFEYGIMEGINDGFLVPVQQYPIYVDGLDYSAVRTTAGELNGKDLAAILEFESNLHGMATPILDLCKGKTLIFTASVAQAERMSEILNRHKPFQAEFVTGETPKEYRRQLFTRYAEGQFQYLVNVGVLTEGYDEPGIKNGALGRPTESRALAAQMIGRILRPLPGVVDGIETAEARKEAIANSDKPYAMIYDFVGVCGNHKLIHPTDILGGNYSDKVIELAQKTIEEGGKPADIATELVKAEREIARRRRMLEDARSRDAIKGKADYSVGTTINPFDLLDIVPCREPAWHKGRLPTVKQLAYLRDKGIEPPEGLSFVHASQLIDTLIKRRQTEPPSPKQAKVLRRFGYSLDGVTFAQASQIITQLAAKGWKR